MFLSWLLNNNNHFLLITLNLFLFLTDFSYSQACVWSVGGKQLDLRHFMGEEIQATTGTYTYKYTPCRDAEGCDGEKGMAVQTEPSTGHCSVLGYWGKGPDGGTDGNQVIPTQSGSGTYLFDYNNGDGCDARGGEPRHWIVTFICDQTVDNYAIDGDVIEQPTCEYRVNVKTKCVCDGVSCAATGGGSDSSDGISGGWIFIIILIGALFLYFVIGWIVCGAMNKDGGFGDIKGNIPHSAFWCALPSLVWAGCCVTKETIMGLFNKGGAKSEPTEAAE